MNWFLRFIFSILIVVCVNMLPQDSNSPNDLGSYGKTLDTLDIFNEIDTIPDEKNPASIVSNEPDTSNDVINAENSNSFTTEHSDTINGADGTDTSLMTWLDVQPSANLATLDLSTPDPSTPDSFTSDKTLKQVRKDPKPEKPRKSKPPPFYCLGGRKQVCCTRTWWSAGWTFSNCVFWNEFSLQCITAKRSDCCMHIHYPEPNLGIDCTGGYSYTPEYESKTEGNGEEPEQPGNVEDATVQQKDPITGALYATPPQYEAPDDGPPARNQIPGACPANIDKELC